MNQDERSVTEKPTNAGRRQRRAGTGRRGRCLVASVAAVLALASAPAAAEQPDELREPVSRLHQGLTSVTERAGELGFEERFEALAPVIEAAFDLSALARTAVGRRHWPKFSAEQQQAFVDAYRRYTVATYANRFDSSGVRFEFREQRSTQGEHYWLRYYILPPDGDRVSIDYLVQNDGGGWHIVNVLSDGVSELALQRAQFDSILKKDGVDSLIEEVRKKADDLAE